METILLISMEALIFAFILFLFLLDRKNREMVGKLDAAQQWQTKRLSEVARDLETIRGQRSDGLRLSEEVDSLSVQVYLLQEELDRLTAEKKMEETDEDEEALKAKAAEKLFTEGIASILGYGRMTGKRGD